MGYGKDPEKLLLTVEEAMKLLGIRTRTLLYYYRDHHGLPYVKIGHLVRFPARELKEWKATNEKAAPCRV